MYQFKFYQKRRIQFNSIQFNRRSTADLLTAFCERIYISFDIGGETWFLITSDMQDIFTNGMVLGAPMLPAFALLKNRAIKFVLYGQSS